MHGDALTWPLPLQTLSASSFATFARCAETWRRRYVLGETERPAAASVMGKAVHGSAEINYRQKRVTGEDMPLSDVEQAYASEFDNAVEQEGGESEVEWQVKIGRDRVHVAPGHALDLGLPLARSYRTAVSPHVQPIGAEEWFDLRVSGVPVPIKGKIDLITNLDKTDIKFGAQAKRAPDTSWRMQALLYMLVDTTDNLDGIAGMPFAWHTGSWGSDRYGPKLWTPASAPELVIEKTAASVAIASDYVRGITRAIVSYWNQFGPDEPWPGTGLQHTWACGFCGFKPTCPYWVREEVPTLL